jgi:hypothetical protein
VIQSVDVCEHLHSVGLTHNLGSELNTTYHHLDFGYDHGDHNHTRPGPVPSHMLFPCPTSPSHFGKGQNHDGPDMEASKSMSLCEANANANAEKGDKQRQPKTFFRGLNNVTRRKETKGEERR